jgi:hypothetical protein
MLQQHAFPHYIRKRWTVNGVAWRGPNRGADTGVSEPPELAGLTAFANTARCMHGIPALTWDATLTQAAQSEVCGRLTATPWSIGCRHNGSAWQANAIAASGCLGTQPATQLGVTVATALASSLLTSLEHAWYKDPMEKFSTAPPPGPENTQATYMRQLVRTFIQDGRGKGGARIQLDRESGFVDMLGKLITMVASLTRWAMLSIPPTGLEYCTGWGFGGRLVQ